VSVPFREHDGTLATDGHEVPDSVEPASTSAAMPPTSQALCFLISARYQRLKVNSSGLGRIT
jgi:hypothetical protein